MRYPARCGNPGRTQSGKAVHAGVAQGYALREQAAGGCAIKILLIAVLLAGCASTPPPATQTVEVPVYVPCVKDRPQRPVYEFVKLPADVSDGRKVMALARDWPPGRKYEGELEAALAGCL